jgi:radical SAM-linked protein
MWTYRIKYTKTGSLRFISHLDVMRALTRALRRAEILVAYSKGFNPRPKISMGPPLPLGYESRCELADLTLARMLSPHELHQRLGTALPPGLELIETDWVSPASERLSDASLARYMIRLHERQTPDDTGALIRDFLRKDSVRRERMRKGQRKEIDIRPGVADAYLVTEPDSNWMCIEIVMGNAGSCSASEAAQAILGIAPESAKCLHILRTDIEFRTTSQQVKTDEKDKKKKG